MSFHNLTGDKIHSPVKHDTNVQVIWCGNFTGELSSTTGIQSKFLFIPKLVPSLNPNLESQSLPPSVLILCGPECKDYCVNLYKKK